MEDARSNLRHSRLTGNCQELAVGLSQLELRSFALSDIRPDTHHLIGLSGRIPHYTVVIINPAVSSILMADSVFHGIAPLTERLAQGGQDPLTVLGMQAL